MMTPVFKHILLLITALALLLVGCGRTERSAEQPVPITPALIDPLAPAAQPGLGAYPVAEMAPAEATSDPYPIMLEGTVALPLPTYTPPPPPQQTQTAATFQTESAIQDRTQFAVATVNPYTPTPPVLTGPASFGPLLRDIWPFAPKGTPRVTVLLLVRPGEWESRGSSVWRVQLPSGQQSQIASLDSDFYGAVLSSDQRQLIYLAGGDRPLMRVKDLASQQETYFWHFGVGMHAQCSTKFAWSPDGRLLAFRTTYTKQRQLRIYSGGAVEDSKVILKQPLAMTLLGWLDNDRVLVLTQEPPYEQTPFLFVAVNWRTGVQQQLASIPAGRIDCFRLSPNRRQMLFEIFREHAGSEQLVLDIATGQISPSGIRPVENIVWAADNTTVLLPSTDDGRTMKLRRLDQPDAKDIFLGFNPPIRSFAAMKLLDASPDGRWLLACTKPGSTWLYDIAADRWTDLGEGCSQSLGWWPRREDTR